MILTFLIVEPEPDGKEISLRYFFPIPRYGVSIEKVSSMIDCLTSWHAQKMAASKSTAFAFTSGMVSVLIDKMTILIKGDVSERGSLMTGAMSAIKLNDTDTLSTRSTSTGDNLR